MNIVVTGAEGFIGKQLCEKFSKENYVAGWDLIIGRENAFQTVSVNMMSEEQIINRLKIDKPDLLLHCAGSADIGKSIDSPLMDYSSNVTLTHNLFFALRKAKCFHTRVFFFSSAGVYGNPITLPIAESASLSPVSPYALHKLMCEDICFYFAKNYDMDIKIARVFSAYGPGLRKQIFWDMYRKAKETKKLIMYGTGEESRDYIYITDLIEAIYLIATLAPKKELIYNVSSGIETTILEATKIFADNYGILENDILFSGEKKEGNPVNWRADISKLERLGYKAKVSLPIGVGNYIDWIQRGVD